MLDYAAIAVPRLTGQFENSPKLKALMAAIVGPLTTLETDADAVIAERWIDTIPLGASSITLSAGEYPSLQSASDILSFSRASIGSYFDSVGVMRTAGVDVPRFSHNTATMDSTGLLIEEQRTNYMLKSEEFSGAAWLKSQSTVSPNVITSPDGTITADKLVMNTTANATHNTYRNATGVTSAIGDVGTFSVFAKKGEFNSVFLQFTGGAGYAITVSGGATFNLNTGAVIFKSTQITARITPIGNDWYRCEITATATEVGAWRGRIFMADSVLGASTGNITFATGDGVSGIYIWGAQFEYGAYASSYIKTDTSIVTREADIAKTKPVFNKQLDGCGAIVGESRQGRADEAYRVAIKFRVFVNISKGTPTDLIRGLKFLTDPTNCQYLEAYPATALLFTNGFFVDHKIQPAMQDLAPAAISDVPVAVSFADKPFRFAREPIPGELFVNGDADYLTAEGSDIQVSQGGVAPGAATFGGCVPAELDVGIGYLDVGGPTLAVYNPNSLNTLGHDNLTGVFQ